VRAQSPREGVARLSWDAAVDNAGIAGYDVTRPGLATQHLDANQTVWEDLAAPAGQTVTYALRAVDVAGRRGPAVEASVRVQALPHLQNATFGPATGRSDRPFHVEVVYRHAADAAPTALELRFADKRIPLLRLDPSEDCMLGCRYGADPLLPPRSVLAGEVRAVLHVEADGAVVETEVPMPLVTLGDGVRVGGEDVPGLPVLLLMAALAVVAHLRRRRLQ
jgi:hypothetical protein